MDDARRLGTLLAVGVHMAHHVVADLFFPLLGDFVVDVVLVGFQFVNLLLGNVQPQLPLGLGQGDPKPPPGAEFEVVGEKMLHFPAGIAGGQGGNIGIMGHIGHLSFFVRRFAGIRAFIITPLSGFEKGKLKDS